MRRHSLSSRIVFFIAICWLTGAPSTHSSADLITFQVKGTVIGFDGPPLAPLAIGQSYTSTFAFESNTAATPVFGGGNDYIGAISSATFSIGTYNGTLADSSATTIRVLDNFFNNSDFYGAFLGDVQFGTPGAISAPPVTGPLGDLNLILLQMIHLEDFFPSLDGLSSSDLPLTPPDTSLFDVAAWIAEFRSEDQNLFGRVRGNIQSFSLVEVPEPSTLALFGVGLAGLGWMSRLRKA